MPTPLSGPGVGLPLAQNLYPSELGNAPYDFATNKVTLQPGEQLPIPAGNWYITLGEYLVLQFLDPITGVWQMSPSAAWDSGLTFVKSDGFTVRIANLTGCLVGAVVTSYGNSYVQATTTITVTGATATFIPIVGGQLATTGTFTIDVPTKGAGYGVSPMAFIPAPPPASNNSNGVGGIPACGWASLQSGTINGFSFTNPGAGYPSAPAVVVLPNPTDPNIATGITQASISLSLTGAGSICGVLCSNNGAALINGSLASITLAVAGAGTSATIVPQVLQTIISATVSGVGTGYAAAASPILTIGGGASAGTITNSPDALGLSFRPRPAQIAITSAGASISQGTAGTIYDGGLFLTPPTGIAPPNAGGASITLATIAFFMGGVKDMALLQPAP